MKAELKALMAVIMMVAVSTACIAVFDDADAADANANEDKYTQNLVSVADGKATFRYIAYVYTEYTGDDIANNYETDTLGKQIYKGLSVTCADIELVEGSGELTFISAAEGSSIIKKGLVDVGIYKESASASLSFMYKADGKEQLVVVTGVTVDVEIIPATIVSDAVDFTYNHETQTTEITVWGVSSKVRLTYTEGTPSKYIAVLSEGTAPGNYVVTGERSGINAGEYTYTVTVIDGGNYTGSFTATWKILPKQLTSDMIDYGKWSFFYVNEGRDPVTGEGPDLDGGFSKTLKVEDDPYILVEDVDFTYEKCYKGVQVDVGKYSIIFTGIGNYTGEVDKPWYITPENIARANLSVIPKTLVYNAEKQGPEVTVRNFIDGTLTVDKDFVMMTKADFENLVKNNPQELIDILDNTGIYALIPYVSSEHWGKDVGVYDMVLVGKNNYRYVFDFETKLGQYPFENKSYVEFNYQITPRDITLGQAEVVEGNFVYNAEMQSPVIAVDSDVESPLVEGKDYLIYVCAVDEDGEFVTLTGVPAAMVDAGTYYLSVVGIGNYMNEIVGMEWSIDVYDFSSDAVFVNTIDASNAPIDRLSFENQIFIYAGFKIPGNNYLITVYDANGVCVIDELNGVMEGTTTSQVNFLSIYGINSCVGEVDNVMFNAELFTPLKKGATFTAGDYTYKVTNVAKRSVSVIGADESVTEVVIPKSVNGYNVTSVASKAFYANDKIVSVDLGNVTSVGTKAFAKCTSLESIDFGDSIRTIGAYAFYGCTKLTYLNMPDSVLTIKEYAFAKCSGLKVVIFGENLESYTAKAFSGMTFKDADGKTAKTAGALAGNIFVKSGSVFKLV